MNFDTDIKFVKGVGDVMKTRFEKIGVTDVGSLLYYFPVRYDDWSDVKKISDCELDEISVIKAKVITPLQKIGSKSPAEIYKTLLSDGSDVIEAVFFNNKYITNELKTGETYFFRGKLRQNEYNGAVEILSPRFSSENENPIKPVYHMTAGLTGRKISKTVNFALESMKGNIKETLPSYEIEKFRLEGLENSITSMHFPQNFDSLFSARRRLVFEELLTLQLGLLLIRSRTSTDTDKVIKKDYSAEFERKLPFEFTVAQKKAVFECVKDMMSGRAMNRLVQGDVGSGKTAVAASVIYTCVKNGFRAALMAPTEILANQHADTLKKFFGSDLNIALLTGSLTKSKKNELLKHLKSGEIDLLVGTHALISEDVEFNNLGLVITDEQHRFGVEQRTRLQMKGDRPHVLVMSATPIPRTLGLIIYGDLDVSLINELPSGRKPVKTYVVNSSYHKRIYQYIKKFLDSGKQAYIVCSKVADKDEDCETENEENNVISAEEYFKTLSEGEFKNYRLGLIHGKMKQKEKDAVMADFASGKINMLVATTVIEVGVDVPNACVMVIENAERFGLSSLHQLRGRIGRGQSESVCILISDSNSEETKERLDILRKTSDGFKIAEEDLKMRGPGDFLGSRQHGLPELKLANLVSDASILKAAADEAKNILSKDPYLSSPENAPLSKNIEKMFRNPETSGIN